MKDNGLSSCGRYRSYVWNEDLLASVSWSVPSLTSPLFFLLQDEHSRDIMLNCLVTDPYDEYKGTHPTSHKLGGFRWKSPEQVKETKKRRSVVWKFIRSAGLGLFRDGVNMTKISLPVQLFEGKSFLERLSDSWVYRDLLKRAAACNSDPVERMRCIVAFAMGGLRHQVSAYKPFNPILGETRQGIYRDGTEVYFEQISHHPPISAWQMFDAQSRFVFEGCANYEASTRANSIVARQLGVNRITFADTSDITWELPELHVLNIMFGQMYLRYRGVVVFEDVKHSIVCRVEVDPPKPKGWKALSPEDRQQWHTDMVVGSLEVKGKVIDRLTGSWLSHLTWLEAGVRADGSRGPVRYHTTEDRVERPVPFDVAVREGKVKGPRLAMLPSDSRERADLQSFLRDEMETAHTNKVALEELQRADAKCRAMGKKLLRKESRQREKAASRTSKRESRKGESNPPSPDR